jgi:predicted transcriptional regulator
MTALLVKEPWATMIVNGDKTIEIRTRRTKKINQEIFIAKSGSKTLIGKVTIVKCAPLTPELFDSLSEQHKAGDIYPGKKIYGWFLSNPIKFDEPIPYTHPHGAQMWVNIPVCERKS